MKIETLNVTKLDDKIIELVIDQYKGYLLNKPEEANQECPPDTQNCLVLINHSIMSLIIGYDIGIANITKDQFLALYNKYVNLTAFI